MSHRNQPPTNPSAGTGPGGIGPPPVPRPPAGGRPKPPEQHTGGNPAPPEGVLDSVKTLIEKGLERAKDNYKNPLDRFRPKR